MDTKILSLLNVGYRVNDETILQNITFNVNEGEKVTVTGPSGSGKSTLMKLVGSMLTPSEGTIEYLGTSVEDIEPTEFRKEVSYFFQNAQLFDETVRDNLSFPYMIREEEFSETRGKELLEQVKLPSTYLTKPIKNLSGGEKQRIALVRNLMFQPKVLLLDEISSSLDAENRNIISDMIDEMTGEKRVTVLTITHDEKEISEADRVVRIVNGRLEDEK